jgi:RHH-type proline utilization regulon transcriptional repressor/proline dehydrogenase/delta 1-pyrroline-5-carboxylate dehydrogenase
MSADFSAADLAAIEAETTVHRPAPVRQSGRHAAAHLEPSLVDDRMMAWSMQDESLKVQLFRFVDVLPMLGSADSVTEHLSEYLETVERQAADGCSRRPRRRSAYSVHPCRRRPAARSALRTSPGGSLREKTPVRSCEPRGKSVNLRRGFTLDILGEAVISETEAEQYFRAYIDLLEAITPEVQSWPADSLIDEDARGPIPRVNLSVKLSALDSQFDALDHEGDHAPRRRASQGTVPRCSPVGGVH